VNQEEKITSINRVLKEYFSSLENQSLILAKDLMPLFVQKGVFPKDYKNGLPLRNIFRTLDKSNQLNAIPYLVAERKTKNTKWYFQPSNAKPPVISTPVKSKKTNKSSAKRKSRKENDENYVLDLCDEVLKLEGSRQHRFPFLLGDAGTKLPVDIYYPKLNLVIEYKERQHFEAVPHFDKPHEMTVSVVSRGEQRRIYDERRKEVCNAHKINFLEISYAQFNYNSSKRIIRNLSEDKKTVKTLLKKYLKLKQTI